MHEIWSEEHYKAKSYENINNSVGLDDMSLASWLSK